MLFVEYPKCTTCKKAKKWLDDNGIVYTDRHIKEKNLKEKIKDMTDEEQYQLLATDGMLVKRPIVVRDDTILVGFKEETWEKALKY